MSFMSDAPAGRKHFVLMLVIVFGTLAGSYALFYMTQGNAVWNTTNAGEFVEPELRLEQLALSKSNGAPFAPEATGNWWLLVAAPAGCTDLCRESLSQMRALQVLITKDATRVRRGLLAAAPIAPDIADTYPKLELLSGAGLTAGVYLIDPVGVVVLRYPLGDSGALVQKDLKKLLKYSRLG